MTQTAAPTIRPAHDEADFAAVLAIYNHYVAETAFTFDLEPWSLAGRRDWFARFDPAGPHRLLLATDAAGGVLGYAYSSRFHERAAYATSVSTSIYLAPSTAGRGVGSALYASLFDGLAELPQLHRAYAGITLPNPASLALHRRFGFEKVAHLTEAGRKFGSFHDVIWLEKSLVESSVA